MAEAVDWKGHEFGVYDISNTIWRDVPGVYIFAGQQQDGSWRAVYIGQAESLASRLPGHERADSAVLQGATAVHALRIDDDPERDALEEELIAEFQPPMNVQHR